MATIKDLVDKHSKVPGDIRVCLGTSEFWFRPFFQTRDGDWVGPSPDYDSDMRPNDVTGGFQLYTEPKPKVMRAQYLIISKDPELIPQTTEQWFLNEAAVRYAYELEDDDILIRLEEREFER